MKRPLPAKGIDGRPCVYDDSRVLPGALFLIFVFSRIFSHLSLSPTTRRHLFHLVSVDQNYLNPPSKPKSIMSMASRIEYSEKYCDELSEYRHVILPKDLAKSLPKNR